MQQGTPINIQEFEKIQPVAQVPFGNGTVLYAVPNSHTLWRVQTLHQKEPDTLEWISGFQAGETLLDVGANVGMYSVWAAKTRQVKVFAFEPESQNYALLNRNLHINQLDGLVKAYPVALSDEEGFNELYLSEFVGGSSCHTFGEEVDFHLKPFQSQFRQGSYATTLDRLVEKKILQVPHYIKIDVDGIEHKVMAGAVATLARPEVKSVLIELNTHLESHREIIAKMRGLGYGLSQEQLKIALRTEGIFAGVGNHIFRRDLA